VVASASQFSAKPSQRGLRSRTSLVRATPVTASPAFARIHHDVMQVVAHIPRGRVTTYSAIGEFLDVVPRQVAFPLARRNDEAREAVPWWRVVGAATALGRPKRAAAGASQHHLLLAEGVAVRDRRVEGLAERLIIPTTRSTGVRPVRRGGDDTASRSSARRLRRRTRPPNAREHTLPPRVCRAMLMDTRGLAFTRHAVHPPSPAGHVGPAEHPPGGARAVARAVPRGYRWICADAGSFGPRGGDGGPHRRDGCRARASAVLSRFGRTGCAARGLRSPLPPHGALRIGRACAVGHSRVDARRRRAPARRASHATARSLAGARARPSESLTSDWR